MFRFFTFYLNSEKLLFTSLPITGVFKGLFEEIFTKKIDNFIFFAQKCGFLIFLFQKPCSQHPL